jgi:excisionase family DNA binding protein
MEKVGLSIAETCERLGVGRTTVYELLKAGELDSVKIGRRRLVPASSPAVYLERLAARQRQQGGAPAA